MSAISPRKRTLAWRAAASVVSSARASRARAVFGRAAITQVSDAVVEGGGAR
jgi:hypothetical protein